MTVLNLHTSDTMKKYTLTSHSQECPHLKNSCVYLPLSLSFFKKDCDHTVTTSVQNVQYDILANGSSVPGFTAAKF